MVGCLRQRARHPGGGLLLHPERRGGLEDVARQDRTRKQRPRSQAVRDWFTLLILLFGFWIIVVLIYIALKLT